MENEAFFLRCRHIRCPSFQSPPWLGRLTTTCWHRHLPPRTCTRPSKDLAGAWPSSAWRQGRKEVSSVWCRGPSVCEGLRFVGRLAGGWRKRKMEEISRWRRWKIQRRFNGEAQHQLNLKNREPHGFHGWLAWVASLASAIFCRRCRICPPEPKQELGATRQAISPLRVG